MKVIFKCERYKAKSGKEVISMINETGNLDRLLYMTDTIKKNFGKKEIIFVEAEVNLTKNEIKVIGKVEHY